MAAHNSKPVGTQQQEANGYWIVKQPDHPLAYNGNGRTGWVKRHRMMYFDHVNGEEQHCLYCGYGPLPWRGTWNTAINIDHFNEVKGDDRIENLLASCFWCNLFKAGWPLTFEEHQRAIHRYNHKHPSTRPTVVSILEEEWGLGCVDIHHNLRITREQRKAAAA